MKADSNAEPVHIHLEDSKYVDHKVSKVVKLKTGSLKLVFEVNPRRHCLCSELTFDGSGRKMIIGEADK